MLCVLFTNSITYISIFELYLLVVNDVLFKIVRILFIRDSCGVIFEAFNNLEQIMEDDMNRKVNSKNRNDKRKIKW